MNKAMRFIYYAHMVMAWVLTFVLMETRVDHAIEIEDYQRMLSNAFIAERAAIDMYDECEGEKDDAVQIQLGPVRD